jgi:hypothetical protein
VGHSADKEAELCNARVLRDADFLRSLTRFEQDMGSGDKVLVHDFL